ncbi:MAG: cytochrome [Betaproteobacteria bacterium]|jgi:virginiamycin B lyase|nr:cytochrome [Betaproteobacteria bacterium]
MSKTYRASLIAAAFVLVPPVCGAQGQAKGPSALPEGKGKPLVQGICSSCHALELISNSSGYTREHWKELTGYMVDLSGSPAQQNEILDYLAANFPPNNKRPAKLVPGNFQVTFKEWVMPQLGQRTRDPVQAADGSIWYAGQFGNLIGHLDRKTGQAREYPLPPNAMPHTVQLDPKGRPWFSGNKNGSIGWIDPATGKATVYKMPDPEATDVHTIAFDKKGMVYFTFQWANMIGRLNPDTGDIKVVKVSAQRSQPYDIKFDSEGMLWVSCNGRPCLLKVHPDTLAITEVKLPLATTTVRRFDIAPDGMIWYVNSGSGRLGRLNPKSGEIREWDSPSGPRSHPYGIAVLDGAIWYNESGVRPDALVRFDPATQTFQSWPIKSGNIYAGILRNARTTPQGTLLIHQTATNRIIEVTPQRRTAMQ